jgi:hypothetical protein
VYEVIQTMHVGPNSISVSNSATLRNVAIFGLLLGGAAMLAGQTAQGNGTESFFAPQAYNKPENCLPCHQRQFDELRSSVKSGYRNVSPLFNGLEMTGNLFNGGALRPVYKNSTVLLPDGTTLNTNMFTSSPITETRQVAAGFCYTCHNAIVERQGDTSTPVVPQLSGLTTSFNPTTIRPLRDYVQVDANGNQLLPPTFGGPVAPGSLPSLASAGITCDVCHNVGGPDIQRSFYQDGFANMSLILNETIEKVGPFNFPVAVKGDFHVASNDQSKIAYIKSGAFCNACHDVRVPNTDLQHLESNTNTGGANVHYYRLENLSTEWQIGPYNSTNNPFGKVVVCQDCHMSNFPFSGNSVYQVGDLSITSPTPGIYAQDYAAVPGVSTDGNYPLSKRQVVNHYFTGVDVPLLSLAELQARLGSDYPDVFQPGTDTHGFPYSIESRREALLNSAVRIGLSNTDPTATVGGTFTVRLEAAALTGHRFPAGFSQERTTYVQLNVTDNNGYTIYQSGYVVDKPHPNTGETAPDGNLNDEDIEHIHAVVNYGGFNYSPSTGAYPASNATLNGSNNIVFELGPDNGPDDRLYSGAPEGLVLFRNELTRISVPGEKLGRNDINGNPIVAQGLHYEETFSAGYANTVDNYRSLSPLRPTFYNYDVTLPTKEQLAALGVTLVGPLHVHAQVNYEHFPPLFLRFLIQETGPSGPTGHNLNLLNEGMIDQFLKNLNGITSADTTVELEQQ